MSLNVILFVHIVRHLNVPNYIIMLVVCGDRTSRRKWCVLGGVARLRSIYVIVND